MLISGWDTIYRPTFLSIGFCVAVFNLNFNDLWLHVDESEAEGSTRTRTKHIQVLFDISTCILPASESGGIDTPVYEDRVAFFLEFFNPSTTSLTRAEDF